MRAWAARWGVLARVATLALVCGCTVSAPILAAGPARPGDAWLYDDALRGARTAGYVPVERDPAAGSFVLVATSDRTHATRFIVQCFSDGWVTIVPDGPSVTRVGQRLVMPVRLRDEYARLADEIGGAVVLWP